MAEFQVVLKEIEERLVYVMSTKETAVQQTLADTEDSLAIIGELKALIDMGQQKNIKVEMLGIDLFPQMLVQLEQLQQRLMQILMTQGYQDLTGQVLKRVMADLSLLSNGTVEQSSESANGSQGFGPATLVSEKTGRIDKQGDVDEFLSTLGI